MSLSLRRPDLRTVAWAGLLAVVLVVQGALLSQSLVWAAPLLCLLLVAVAVDLPIVPFVGLVLLGRVLTDGGSEEATRASASLSPSVMIAGLLVLVAAGMLLRRTRGLATFTAIGLAIGAWTGLAVLADGLDPVVLREGAREASVLAVAVIAYNARNSLDMPTVARIIQVAGIYAALLAIFQVATGNAAEVGGDMRANGTFSHPNGAVVYFALASLASLWRYVDCGRRRLDLLLVALFSLAALSTFSLDGFGSMLVMLVLFGIMRTDSVQMRRRAVTLVGVLVVAFLLSPVGSERVSESLAADLSGGESRAASENSLSWRILKWESLLAEWEESPILGKGLGKTITPQATATNTTVGNLPHNEYLRYLVETGLAGTALLLGSLVLLLRRLNRVPREMTTERGIAVLAMAAIVGLMVNALASNTALYTPAMFAAALLIATALRCTAGAVKRSPTPRIARARAATA